MKSKKWKVDRIFPRIKTTPIIETLKTELPFESVFASLRSFPGSALLNSSMGTDAGRYSFIGVAPFLTLKSKGGRISVTSSGRTARIKGEAFDILGDIIDNCRIKSPFGLEFAGGGIGYFSYELKDRLEKLPGKAKDDLKLPDMYFNFYRAILIHDIEHPGKVTLSVLDIPSLGRGSAKKLAGTVKGLIKGHHVTTSQVTGHKVTRSQVTSIRSNFTKPAYIKTVKKSLEHIRAGNIYQVCLSQRFTAPFEGEAYGLYLRLNELSPAPFSAYLDFEEARIISSSPELFLKVADGHVETRPMKGTRPRGRTRSSDNKLFSELKSSEKDKAELAMIVDLERNDLGKVCAHGSIKVIEHRRIEKYPTVFQAISVIKGKLAPGVGLVDTVKAAFPGGSISGCPKIRAMEIIDSLEPTARGVYTGAIGYLSFHDTMELSVAIRTMIEKNRKIYFQTGGGIVADSDPEKEYKETLVKAKAMIQALSRGARRALSSSRFRST